MSLELQIQKHLHRARSSMVIAKTCLDQQQYDCALRYGAEACTSIESAEQFYVEARDSRGNGLAALRYETHLRYMQILLGIVHHLVEHHGEPTAITARLQSLAYYAKKERLPREILSDIVLLQKELLRPLSRKA